MQTRQWNRQAGLMLWSKQVCDEGSGDYRRPNRRSEGTECSGDRTARRHRNAMSEAISTTCALGATWAMSSAVLETRFARTII